MFRIAGLDEIKRWVLSLGPEAFVIEPEGLREIVQKDLEKTLHRYHVKSELRETESRTLTYKGADYG